MNRYRLKTHQVVRAVRFDDPDKLPTHVVKGNSGDFGLQLKSKKYALIELGDWIVYVSDGSWRPLNHETFSKLYERIEDIDSEDVSDQYLGTDAEAR